MQPNHPALPSWPAAVAPSPAPLPAQPPKRTQFHQLNQHIALLLPQQRLSQVWVQSQLVQQAALDLCQGLLQTVRALRHKRGDGGPPSLA